MKKGDIGDAPPNSWNDMEAVINARAAKGYRLHTISTSTGHSTGFGGGDRI
ncbi:MAG: DUF4177 domain-containing protein [Clostridia bacterium]|nr:DUF4177 domain-containing protein [Clostridia bacterium]